jgi:hypothetical protein
MRVEYNLTFFPNRITRVCFISTLIIMLASGCSIINRLGSHLSEPSYGSEPGIPESPILFQDDFNKAGSGWTTSYSGEGSSVDYSHQGLEFYNNEVEKDYWSTREGEYGNVGVGVDASKLGGPDDNSFGVICRYHDAENFYAFLVSSDGYYGIIKVKDGNYALLSGKNMDFNSGIVRGRGTNRVLGVCSEDELGLFVNGSLLTIVQDSDFTEGQIGLISGSNATPGTDILFDNLILYQQ